jgi:hypothetical protein
VTEVSVQRDDEREEGEIHRYFARGERAALSLDNRGPIRYDAHGAVHPEIIEAYSHYGFYVFEDVVGDDELAELATEAAELLERAPHPDRDAPTDRRGQPAAGRHMAKNPWIMATPLSDPVGGTHLNHGRHPVKMREPAPAEDAPAQVPYLVFGCLEMMPSFLRATAQPDLLRVAEAIHGPDFTPFTESLFVKLAGLGPSVSWHQDGQIHWDNPEWDENIHGFNFQLQLHGSTPANGVWVIPGSHRSGKLDIEALVAANDGCERLPDAVPLVGKPGDCFIANRQTLHCSFPNTSADPRITVNFGFHRRSAVIGQTGVLTARGKRYDEEYVHRRSRCIALAIDARAKRFPDEVPYRYQPLASEADENRWDDPEARRAVLGDYNLFDLAI